MQNLTIWTFNKAGHVTKKMPLIEEFTNPSMDQVTSTMPIGAYTTFRTFNNNEVFHLDEHLSRLENTFTLEQKKLPVTKAKLRVALRHVIDYLPPQDYRVRILIPTQVTTPEGYIIAETLIPYPQKYYREGIRVVTINMTRNKPRAKLSTIIQDTAAIKEKLLAEYQEIILMDENGFLLEGISSNFFALANNILYTAHSGILEGITRRTILQVIKENHIPQKSFPIHVSSITSLQEAFISSSSRGVFPVVRINEIEIGKGIPGEITQRISTLYNQKIQTDLVPI